MKTEFAIELLRRGRRLAASVPPQRSGYLAWAGIYPLDASKCDLEAILTRYGFAPRLHTSQQAFRIRVFEIQESVAHSNTWFGENDLHSRADVVVIGEHDLMQAMERLGIPPDALDEPWKVDYPL